MATTAGPPLPGEHQPGEHQAWLVVTGTVTLDTLHLPTGRHEEVPGGSAVFGALGASTLGPCVLLGRCGTDLTPEALRPLAERGIDLRGLEHASGPSFRWEARYSDDLTDRVTVHRALGVGREAPGLDSNLGTPDWAFLGSMHPAIQRSVATALGAGVRYGVDTMGHWARERRVEVMEVVKNAEVLFVSEGELQLLTGRQELAAALASLFVEGVRHVVVKAGRGGARVFLANGTAYRCPSFPTDSTIDPTGAGDALGGAYVASLMRGASPAESLAKGIAAASFAVERVSLHGWSEVDASAVRRRTEWTLGRTRPIHPL